MPDPYKNQKGFGKELGKTLKLIAWCLHDWSEKHSGETMSAIAFDKLVELVCRYWDSLRQDGLVSFSTPFVQRFGIHGSGRTLRQSPKPSSDTPDEDSNHPFMYAGKVIQIFNGLLHGEHQLFKIEDPEGKREFSTGLTSAQMSFWESDEKFLTREELGVFSELRLGLAGLSADQIRLLGTHTSAPDNERTLRKIGDRWSDAIRSAFKCSSGTAADLKVFGHRMLIAVRNARELLRKSGENKVPYGGARRSFLAALKNTQLEKTAANTQNEAKVIWGASGTETWRAASALLFRISKYIYACSLRAMELQGGLLDKNQKNDLVDGERSRRRLKTQLKAQTIDAIPLLPRKKDDAETARGGSDELPEIEKVAQSIVDGTGIEWLSRLQDHLCRDFAQLLNESDGRGS